jgi:hypothetical protein
MTEKTINFAERIFTTMLLLVIFAQTGLILSMSRVKPADVVKAVEKLEDAIAVSNHIIAANDERVKEEIQKSNEWMRKIEKSLDDSVKDRVYREDIVKWVNQVKQPPACETGAPLEQIDDSSDHSQTAQSNTHLRIGKS